MNESEGTDGAPWPPASPPEPDAGLDAEPYPEVDAGTDPGTDAAIRDLLADAADTAPLPADVGARLDQTLARLVAGDSPHDASTRANSPDGSGPIAARRRRRWPTVLVGAAAVTLLGYVGVGVLTGPDHVLGSGSAASDSAGSSPDESGTATEEAPESRRGDTGAAGDAAKSPAPVPDLASEKEPSASSSFSGQASGGLPALHGLGADVTLLSQALGRDSTGTGQARDLSRNPAEDGQGCAPARGEHDWTRVVELDGEPTRLVLRTTGGVRTLEAWPCSYAFVPSATVFLRS